MERRPSTLALRVLPSPSTNDHEVQILIDGEDLIAPWSMMGMDPDDLLDPVAVLMPQSEPHRTIIARCGCGVVGCGSVSVCVSLDAESVVWDQWEGDATPRPGSEIRFDRDQYVREVTRASNDHGWESPDRTAARLIRSQIAPDHLQEHGLRFHWASGRITDHRLTVSLILEPGPFQVLLHVPWRNESPEEIAKLTVGILSRPPQEWADVEWLFQGGTPGATPTISGPGWHPWRDPCLRQ